MTKAVPWGSVAGLHHRKPAPPKKRQAQQPARGGDLIVIHRPSGWWVTVRTDPDLFIAGPFEDAEAAYAWMKERGTAISE